jgi:hypothetical protein
MNVVVARRQCLSLPSFYTMYVFCVLARERGRSNIWIKPGADGPPEAWSDSAGAALQSGAQDEINDDGINYDLHDQPERQDKRIKRSSLIPEEAGQFFKLSR